MTESTGEKFSLRACVYIDNMQPQYSALVGKEVKGDMPVEGMAQLYVEVHPATEILKAMDVVLKDTNARPGILLVERSNGSMEVHSFSRTDIDQAKKAIEARYGPEESQIRPQILSAEVITRVDAYEAQLLTNFVRTSYMIAEKSLLVLEVVPSCFATLACNEAEKHADITVVAFRWTGQTGRVYISGTEEHVIVARDAALEKIAQIPGREPRR
jgi:hypothetical protein